MDGGHLLFEENDDQSVRRLSIELGPIWGLNSGVCEIIWSPDGNPIREIAPRSYRPVGRYNSRKAGRMLHHESRGHGRVGGEKLALMLCEIDPDVHDFRAQHIQFRFPLRGRLSRYTPDIVRVMADNRLEIIEVKSDDRWRRNEEYAEKIALVSAICDQVGFSFAVWPERSIAPTPRVRVNIVQIQMERYAAIEESHVLLVRAALYERGGTATVGQLGQVLGGWPGAEAFVRAMMCRGVLRLPLDEAINADTVATMIARTGRRLQGSS
jgi:hypothetical protein